MEAISVKNLSVAYENNTIIEDMSLSIPKEKISIIIGANGCGKSTLLKTIARINKPKSGDIFINNKNIKKVKEKNIAKEVAFLPQGPVDEPTTYLDMSYQLEVLEVLQKLNKEKKITVVIVLHELNNACRFADNIIGLKKGKIICEGRPLDVINKENLNTIYGIDANLTISEDGKYPICMEYDLFRGINEK